MHPVVKLACSIVLAALASAAGTARAAQPQLLPDLAVIDAQVAGSNPARLRIRIANLGLAPAVETRIELTYRRGGGETRMTAPVPLLLAGERQWLVMEIGMRPAEADAIVLRIDEPSIIIEADEENNAYAFNP